MIIIDTEDTDNLPRQATLPALKQQGQAKRSGNTGMSVSANVDQTRQRLLHQVYKSVAEEVAKQIQASYSAAAELENDPDKSAALTQLSDDFTVFCVKARRSLFYVCHCR